MVSEIAHQLLLIKLYDYGERPLALTRCTRPAAGTAADSTPHRTTADWSTSKYQRRGATRALGVGNLSRNFVVNPNLTPQFIRSDNVGRTKHGSNIGCRHAHVNLALDLANGKAISSVITDSGFVFPRSHASCQWNCQHCC